MPENELILQRFTALEQSLAGLDKKLDDSYPNLTMINLMLEPIRNDVKRIGASVDMMDQRRTATEQQIKIAILSAVLSPFVAMITTIIATIVLSGGIKIS